MPSDGAFSRFKQTLIEVDETSGCVQALFEAQRHKLTGLLPDFGLRVGYDGKAIQSHSTDRRLVHRVAPLSSECLTSGPVRILTKMNSRSDSR